MDPNDLLFTLVPFAAIAALATWFAVMFRRRAWQHVAPGRGRGSLVEPGLATPPRDARRPSVRPWWGNPWLWVAISGIFLVLGVFVWPGLFGGIFVFLPFVWVSRPRPVMDPRGNGHDARDRGGAAPL